MSRNTLLFLLSLQFLLIVTMTRVSSTSTKTIADIVNHTNSTNFLGYEDTSYTFSTVSQMITNNTKTIVNPHFHTPDADTISLPSTIPPTAKSLVSVCLVQLRGMLRNLHTTLVTSSPLSTAFSILFLYFTGSLFFDLAHHTLHKFSNSTSPILRSIGYLHQVHHLYFNRRLKFNNKYQFQNTIFELPLELLCQLFGTYIGYLLLHSIAPTYTSLEILYLVMIFEVLRSLIVMLMEGKDSNHKSYAPVVPKDPSMFLVGPEYHALHHVDPDSYIGSTFKVFDWVCGTSSSLRSRRVTVLGHGSTFGGALKSELEAERVACIEDVQVGIAMDDVMVETLARTDILILESGVQDDATLDEQCASFDVLVAAFKAQHKAKVHHALLLPEVWYLDTKSNVLCSASASTNSTYTKSTKTLSQHVKKLHDDDGILYRHIAYRSSIFGIDVEPIWAARWTMWWIRRGARTTPA